MPRHKSSLFLTIFWAVTATVALAVGLDGVLAGTSSAKIESLTPYPDSAQGLKHQLKDMLDLARKRKSGQLEAMIEDFEIPDAKRWYSENFGPPGLETADQYQKNLKMSEQQLEDQMIEFAREDGYFSVRRQDVKKVYPDVSTTPEVFLASWEHVVQYGEAPSETPIGYFFFIDGKFRWDSTIKWVTVD